MDSQGLVNSRSFRESPTVPKQSDYVAGVGRLEQPSLTTYLAALKQCSRGRDLAEGKRVHLEVISNGLIADTYICSSLINMYSKCRSMHEARAVFTSLLHPDTVCWNCLLSGHVENAEYELALELFHSMMQRHRRGPAPNARTCVAALTACSSLCETKREQRWKWLEKGRSIHQTAVNSRCSDIFVETTLVDMYVKCGSMAEARKVFDGMTARNVVSWTALLQGYVESGDSALALGLFDRMDCDPDERTYLVAITACATLVTEAGSRQRWLERGRQIHSRAVVNGRCDVFVETAVIDMYCKSGYLRQATGVFSGMRERNVVTWNVFIQGWILNGHNETALEIFQEMDVKRWSTPDARSYVAALSACATLAAKQNDEQQPWVEKGEQIYRQARSRKCCNLFVDNTLMHLYASSGRMSEARRVFDSLLKPDVVSWNCLLQGYVDNRESHLVLQLLPVMDSEGVGGNGPTFVAALLACGNLMAVERGEEIHAEIRSCGLENDELIATCLVDFYGKCGCTGTARAVFESIGKKTIVAWNALLSGYGLQGDSLKVLQSFERLREGGLVPDAITFTSLLTACSHAGLTDKGKQFFDSMSSEYGISPDITHYSCLIDLFCRSNHLDEALRIVRSMPFKADAFIWSTLLKWSNSPAVGELAYENLLSLDEQDSTAYVLMANLKTFPPQLDS